MSYDYSENILVQEAAGQLLEQELGWEVKYAYNTEVLGKDGTFGRASYGDILLLRDFRLALQTLNPWITAAQMEEAEGKMLSRLSTASLMQINEEKYGYIRDGIPVTEKTPDGKTTTRRALVIDFEHPHDMDRNHFLAIKELKIHGQMHRRRTDIVGFVNGIPLLFVELKKDTVDVENAYTDNYTDYLDTIPHLFYYNAFLMLSNGDEAKVGTLGSKYEFFHEWKRLSEEEQAGSVALATMLRGICNKETFLDLLENFIVYDHSDGRTVKILARNHQYLGVNEAYLAYQRRKLTNGKLGVFWHTQGSGKSYSMVFLAGKIRRKSPGSPTIVVLTDREELNKQISETFEGCGLLGGVPAKSFKPATGEKLMEALKGNPSFIFTLIQKFNKANPEPIYPDHDILIMSDEAHRTQNGIFADNMMTLLPTASRIGFTGTPLMSDDNITERTFGGYISVYDFKRAVEDGATVPLYYENRQDRLAELDRPEITDRILDAIEAADLDPDKQEKLEHEFEKEIHLLTAEPRLRSAAKDFVAHYSDLWETGKAMYVCLNKVTCVRMYNYVQEYWQEAIDALRAQIAHTTDQQVALELERKLHWMEETEMCVVVSPEQNEIKQFRNWGLDILPHRQKMEKRELDKEFKDAGNPFRVVFVCAMWLTGFDVKSLSCLYLDKPLKAHTLMQAIARANRVCQGKSNGLVIDYIGIVKALRKALADYTIDRARGGGTEPTVDKAKLWERILEDIAAARAFLMENGFDLQTLIDADPNVPFERLSRTKAGVNAICSPIEVKKTYQTYAAELKRLVKYLDRDEITPYIRESSNAIIAIYDRLMEKRKHIDNTELMVQISSIISEYVSVEVPAGNAGASRQFDISRIDFDLLRREFAKAKEKKLVLKELEELVQARLDQMLGANPTRADYYARYQQIIDEYNREQDTAIIEKTFIDLMDLTSSLDQEQKRYVREGFSSDEELSVYDMLFSEDLSRQDIKKIKEVSVELLAKIKERIAQLDHWTEKDETRSKMYNLIRDTLWQGLPECYDQQSVSKYTEIVYEYVYIRYKEAA